MAWYRCGGGGVPASLKHDMNVVLNKKFHSLDDYDPEQWPGLTNLLGKLPEATVSGAIANITDGADAVPCKTVVATIAPTLTGVSSVDVARTRRNLFDKTKATIGKYINVNGQEATNAAKAHSELLPLKPSTAYYMSGHADASYYSILALDKDMNVLSTWYGGASKTEPFVATTPNNARWCYLNFNADQIDNVIFAESATAIPYETYNGTTYTADLGRTIYGGTADFVNGEGQETHQEIDLGSLTWVYASASNRFYANLHLAGIYTNFPTNANEIADITIIDYETIAFSSLSGDSSLNNKVAGVTTDAPFITIRDTRYSNANDFKNAVTGKKAVILLATPTDFTFTGQRIETMLGVNNFWNNAGDTSVTYRRDIDLALGGQ